MKKKIYIKLIISAGLLLISYLLILAADKIDGFAAFFTANIYPVFAAIFGFIPSLLPISVTEIFIIAIVVILLPFCIYKLVKLRRNKILNYIATTALTITSIFFLYTILLGINYYRPTFADFNDTNPAEGYGADELYELSAYLAAESEKYAGEVSRDFQNVMVFDESDNEILDNAYSYYKDFSSEYDFMNTPIVPPKSVILSIGMSYWDITGIFFPFFSEPNVNTDVPDFIIPFTAMHELTHGAGFMNESEANYVAFLACISTDDTDFLYSGYLNALRYSLSSLYRADPSLHAEIYNSLSFEIITDLAYNSYYWSQFDTVIAEVSNNLNDSFLKANNQQDGIISYGKMTDLLVSYYNDTVK